MRYEAILIGDARRVASIEVFSKVRLSIQRSAHASSSPAAGALCITGQRRRRLTAASRIVVNIEISRVGFDSQLDGENEEKKGVSRSRVNKKETTKRATILRDCAPGGASKCKTHLKRPDTWWSHDKNKGCALPA